MRAVREIVKGILPERVRDGLRYVTNRGYRTMVRKARERAHVKRLVAQSTAQLWTITAGKVASGPFKGLRYIRESVGSEWAPKLLGTYEIELAPIVEAIIATSTVQIVDIGAAEGYYAVGLAWRMPCARVTAFEAHEPGHQLLKDFAALNGVIDRIELRGLCSPDSLNEWLHDGERVVIICDVEGAELQILDPVKAPCLLRADVLVELHPWKHEQVAEVLRLRFDQTHSIQEIHTRPRGRWDLPALANPLPYANLSACMDEMRPCPMSWFWMTVRNGKPRGSGTNGT